MIFRNCQLIIQKMNHYWQFNYHNSESKHDELTPFFSSTLWVLHIFIYQTKDETEKLVNKDIIFIDKSCKFLVYITFTHQVHIKIEKADNITSNFFKAVFHKFLLVHSWIIGPIYCMVILLQAQLCTLLSN